VEGVPLRSRARWIAEVKIKKNKNCGLGKRNYVSAQMIKRTLNTSEEISKTTDIIKAVKTVRERL